MKRLFAVWIMLAAIACLSGTAQAKRWWGGPATTPTAEHDSNLVEVPISELRHFHAYNSKLWYANPGDGGVLTYNHPIPGDTMTFTNKVITGFDLKPSTYGLWITEPGGGPWNGVLVYTGGDNPTALISGLVVGDIVTVTGVISEFEQSSAFPYTETEVNTGQGQNSTFGFRVTKTGHTSLPTTPKVRPGDIAIGGGTDPLFQDTHQDSLCAEQWEGVLVTMDSLQITYKFNYVSGTSTLNGEALLTELVPRGTACRPAAQDTCRIDDKLIIGSDTTTWTLGAKIRKLTGIVSQEFGEYKIWPRDLTNDIVYLGAPPPPDLTRAYAIDNTHVVALFDSKMDDSGGVAAPFSVDNPGNYSMNAPVNVLSGVLSADSLSVTLTTTAMTPGSAQTLTVFNVRTAGLPHTLMAGAESKNFRGGITSINFLQTPKAPGLPSQDSSQVAGEVVTVRGIVVANLGNGEVYMQDATGPTFYGMEAFGSPISLNEGDDVTVAGLVAEFTASGAPSPKTEYNPIYYANLNSSGNTVPAPMAVTVPDIANTGDGGNGNAEKYESTLIQVSGFTSVDTCAAPGRDWWLHAGTPPLGNDSVAVGRIATYNYISCPNDNVNVIGILGVYAPNTGTTIDGGWRIEPRKTTDVYGGNSAGVGSSTVRFALKQSRPNPFANNTLIRYSLSRTGATTLKIYNVGGREIRTLVNGEGKAGEFTATWDGRDASGHVLGSGVYYYRLSQGGETLTRKLVISR